MQGIWRSVPLALLLATGCGSSSKPAPARPVAPVRAEVVEDAPDLSPVPTPAGLFGIGRLSRPLSGAETIVRWAGFPVGLRQLLPDRIKDLDEAIAWDAPVEFALVLGSSRKQPVQAVVTVGLTSSEAAQRLAKARGYALERLAPGVFAVEGLEGASCAIAPALGAARARFVCTQEQGSLADAVPYATRGLPNEKLGPKDLEIELRAQPLRERFGAQLGSLRLLAGFAVRQMALDAPRFDAALSDIVYALADELVALAGDVDVLHIDGAVDASRREVELGLELRMREQRSWVAGTLVDSAQREGPAPDAFFRMPSDATTGSYAHGVDPRRTENAKRALSELLDAYLEHEKVGKATRGRARQLLDVYFASFEGAHVSAHGAAGEAAKTPDGEAEYTLLRLETPAQKWKTVLADMHAVLGDRTLRAAVMKRLKTEDAVLPKSRLSALRGPGVPAGSQALTLTMPAELSGKFMDAVGGRSKKEKAAAGSEHVVTIVADGTGTLIGIANTQKELAARVGTLLSGKGPTLAARQELAGFRQSKVNAAQFSTLLGILEQFGVETRSVSATLPHRGSAPVVGTFEAEAGSAPTGRVRLTVPAALFEDLPGLAPALMK